MPPRRPPGGGRLQRWLRGGLVGTMLAAATLTARADEGAFSVRDGELSRRDGIVYLDARLDYRLSDAATEAMENGVPLVIVQAVQVTRERLWGWWWDAVVAGLTRRHRLQYHALSRRYVLTNLNTGDSRSFRTLNALLPALGEIEDLPVIDSARLQPGQLYRVRLATRLDVDALPRPLRTVAYLSDAWALDSGWRQWELRP